MDRKALRPLEWVASSRKDLRAFPDPVKDVMGFALHRAQEGATHPDAKLLKGLGSAVVEVIANHESGTYRTVYTVRFAKAVYVLHAFQKKSKRDIATPKAEIDVIRARLRTAEAHYAATYGKGNDHG